MSKILILMGSPRKRGNSALLSQQVAQGARSVGAEVESVYLHGMDIRPCDACDSCQGDADLDCIIDDDMQDLYPQIRAADAVVFASPVYWFTVSAQLKIVFDRLYGMSEDVDYPENHALAGKRVALLLTYGGDDPFDSGAVNAIRTFQDIFDYIPAEIVDIVYGQASAAGEIERNQHVMTKAYELGLRLASSD